ncbi:MULTISPECIES: sugar ABC transporter permease [unclassified Nonomuraea]|uniref:carbohydrate ABC transporter permease n=1 Tax=unclassified Nonomuraea TaxID=2593643 RepID=UPI0033ED51E1
MIGSKARTMSAVEARAGAGLAAPAIVYFVLFWALPALAALYLSFTSYDLSGTPQWVGLDNYREMVTSDEFWSSVWVTLLYTVFAVGPTIVIALVVAVPLAKPGRFRAWLRGLVFIPAVMPLVGATVLWQVIYSTGGLADALAGAAGVGPRPWLTDSDYAIWALLVMVIWKYVGLYVIIFVAGLQALPANVFEAAAIDGARTLRTFFLVTVPLLRRTFTFVIVVAVTGAMQSFVPAYLLTKGGPVNATQVLPLYLYNNAFSFSRFGYASAIAIVLLVVLLVFAFTQFTLVRSDEE